MFRPVSQKNKSTISCPLPNPGSSLVSLYPFFFLSLSLCLSVRLPLCFSVSPASSIPSNIFNLRGEVMHAGGGYVAWWLISRFVAFRSKDRGFESISSRHIWSLG